MLQARELPQVNLPEQHLPLNTSGARYNIEKAAYLGFAKAQAKMGAAYELCQLECAFDPVLSLHYNALAARQGEADAEMAISKWFLCGYEGLFEKNEELAFMYAQRAAQNGLPTAEFAIGYFYEVGIHVRPDLTKSRFWYEKAAEHGNKDALGRIDSISRSKTLSRKDHENTAVARIQSQYGSHRGKRPERFKNTGTPMPTIADEYNPIDMPEPKLPTPKPGEYRPSPYSSPNASNPRPPSVAPYPLDDHGEIPPSRPPPRTQSSNQTLRKPVAHPPVPTAGSQTSFGDNNYRGSAFPTFKPSLRPQGPGLALPGRGGPPPPPSVASPQGPNYQRPSTASPHPLSSPAASMRPPPSQSPHPQPNALPKIDIGFSAPPDFSGADKPKRTQKPPDNYPVKSPTGPPPRIATQNQVPGRPQDRLSSLPHPSTMPVNAPPPSPQRRPMSAGMMGLAQPAHAPSPGPSRVDGASLEGLPPPKLTNPNRPAATPPPNPPAPTPKPPGKGPKTFSEMGLPPTKNESDCVRTQTMEVTAFSLTACRL